MTRDPPSLASTENVPIVIQLGSMLAPFRRSSEGALCARCLEADLNVFLGLLGIRSRATVSLGTTRSTRPVRVVVHDQLQGYTPSLMMRAWLAVAPPELSLLPVADADAAKPRFPAGWLGRYAAETADEDEPDWTLMSAFVERLALHAIMKHPSCLLGPAQLTAWKEGLSLPLTDDDLAALLEGLLDLGVSIADRQVVGELIHEGAAIGRPLLDTVEAAFTELRPHRVEIHVHPETLAALLPGSSKRESFTVYAEHIDESLRHLFRDKEAEFFATYGFVLPEFEWVPSPGMEEETVAIKIGEWWGLPVPMVPPGRRLVNAAPAELKGVEARSAIHPVTGAECAVVPNEAKQQLEDGGVVTWGPVDFVILIAHADVSRRPGRLLGMEDIEYQLAKLEGINGSGPSSAVVRAGLAHYTIGDLTRVLRAFVDERLSIRDLAGILERLLEFETVSVADSELYVLDGRLPVSPEATPGWQDYYAFVRRQLSLFLSHVHTWHDSTVVAYLLDPALEERAGRLQDGGLTEDELESLRDSVWAHLQGLSPSPTGQVVVTTTRARAGVRKLLAPEFPDLPVLARAELRPGVKIQQIGTIATRA
ncbi:MAG: FHIPEP family type III secretion protein [Gaiellaceae bacterium]